MATLSWPGGISSIVMSEDFGERGLEPLEAQDRDGEQAERDERKGAETDPVGRQSLVDHVAVRPEQDRPRVRLDEHPQDRILLGEPVVEEQLDRVDPGRDVERETEDVPRQ